MACADGPPPPPPLDEHFVVDTVEELNETLDKMDAIAAEKLKPYDRMIIELCCGETSKLGNRPRHSEGCYVQRVTLRLDFTSERGVKEVIKALNRGFGSQILLWVSFPCTGGSTWQHLNWHRGTDATRERILQHQSLFRRLWINLERIESEILRVGAKIAIEWPKGCAYWKWETVQAFILRNRLNSVILDGCAFGLVAKHGSLKGFPIRKPWRVATNMPELRLRLDRRCACTSVHAPCEGRDTSETEAYTDTMAEQIHLAFRDHCQDQQHRQRAMLAAMSVEEIQNNAKRIVKGVPEAHKSCAQGTSVEVRQTAEVWNAGGAKNAPRLQQLEARTSPPRGERLEGALSGGSCREHAGSDYALRQRHHLSACAGLAGW